MVLICDYNSNIAVKRSASGGLFYLYSW